MEYQVFKTYAAEVKILTKKLSVVCLNSSSLDKSIKNEENSLKSPKELTIPEAYSCSYCQVSFADVSDQRNHYKLDLHRYNLKRALTGDCLTLSNIDLLSSIEDNNTVTSNSNSELCLKKTFKEIMKKSKNENHTIKDKTLRLTKIFFENEGNQILSLHKCLLHHKKEHLFDEDLVNRTYDLVNNPNKWMIMLLGGGHFAAAIFYSGNVVVHKTFHSYTVRAKQGRTQSSRDNKCRSHPKSAGASLRRYNEQSLTQHVQNIVSSWSEILKECSLLLFRATGPSNQGILFNKKNSPFRKTDKRLRNIPFPTKTPSFKEVQRVFDVLTNVEVYGSKDAFKNKISKMLNKKKLFPKIKELDNSNEKNKCSVVCQQFVYESPRQLFNKEGCLKEIITIPDPSSESEDENVDVCTSSKLDWSYKTVNFEDLREYEDTVPQYIKSRKKKGGLEGKKKKHYKRKEKLVKRLWKEEFNKLQENLIKNCKSGHTEGLKETLNIYYKLPSRSSEGSCKSIQTTDIFCKEDFINCLNCVADDESENTLLHIAALENHSEAIRLLLSFGANPVIRNKNNLTPYVVSGSKEAKRSFQNFAASFPDKYDFKKANIPEPLSELEKKQLEEKRKEKRRMKRLKEKIKKQEIKEMEERIKFLSLCDIEKVKLEKETANTNSSSLLKALRCFQCGLDISGKVPFEYNSFKFCSIMCLKDHRAKSKQATVGKSSQK